MRHGEIEQRTAYRGERRRLVVLAPEASQHPVQMRDANRPAQPRARRVLRDGAGEVRQPHARGERQPTQRLVLVFQEQRFQMPGCDSVLGERKSRAVVGDQVDGLVVMLSESVQADARVVPRCHRAEHDLRAGVLRAAVLRGADRRVVRVAVVIGAVVVIERRTVSSMPGRNVCAQEKLASASRSRSTIADAGGLRVRIVGNLIVVAPQRRHEAELVVGVAIVDERPHAAEPPHAIVQDIRDRESPGRSRCGCR